MSLLKINVLLSHSIEQNKSINKISHDKREVHLSFVIEQSQITQSCLARRKRIDYIEMYHICLL